MWGFLINALPPVHGTNVVDTFLLTLIRNSVGECNYQRRPADA